MLDVGNRFPTLSNERIQQRRRWQEVKFMFEQSQTFAQTPDNLRKYTRDAPRAPFAYIVVAVVWNREKKRTDERRRKKKLFNSYLTFMGMQNAECGESDEIRSKRKREKWRNT